MVGKISLHHHQSNHRRGFAEISTHHECQSIFEPALDPKVIVEPAMSKNSNRRPEKTGARKVVRLRGAGKTIVLGVTGSIAAYKSAELASLLVKQRHNVFLVMTHDATEFITPLPFQTLSKTPTMTHFFDEKENWRPGHIELADRTNLLLVAPAPPNIIAELQHGLSIHPLPAIPL